MTQQEQHHQYHKFYNKFWWCDFCTSWIEQKDAKWVQKKIRKFPCCPKPSCNDNRLKTKSTNYKFKSKADAEYRSSKEY